MDYKKEIEKIGLTKKKVAEKLGISNVLLSYYINGARSIPINIEDDLKKIIKIYSEL